MVQRLEYRSDVAGMAGVVVPFRPRADRLPGQVRIKPLPQPALNIVDLAKEPGLPDRLRDLLNR